MESSISATERGYKMMERSLSQERTYWDEKVGEAMREVQKAKELSEEFHKLADRVHSNEPVSPTAGVAQRDVLQFCANRQTQIHAQIEKLQSEVERLKSNRP
jgi:hypothetical protein